jgi:enoyl-CoA hydratase/carnithine racemase
MADPLIIVARHGQVALITLNRPQALNALNQALMTELAATLQAAERDDDIRAVVLTGSEKSFAAGADIREMAGLSFAQAFATDPYGAETRAIAAFAKPLIAAVSGYCLGGGFELAMLADMIFASETARFALPETGLGVIPGMGGSQRLPRRVGQALAMDVILTGRQLSAAEAQSAGLVARVLAPDQLLPQALEAATRIADRPALAIRAAKEAVRRAEDTGLSDGLALERRLFHALFATDDQKEGMAAFLEKRPASFRHR